MVRRYILLYLLSFLFLFRLSAQDAVNATIQTQEAILTKNPDDVEALKAITYAYLQKADYPEATRYGEHLFDIGYQRSDYYNAILYAHTYLGQAYTMLGDSIAYNHLNQAKLLCESSKNDSALCSVYNGMGLYAINIEKDNYSALHYFFQGLDIARRINYERLQGILLSNICDIYYLQKDTVGLRYSLEAYELGHLKRSPYLIYTSSSSAAYMYYLKHDQKRALQFIQEAEFVMERNNFYNQGNVYALYGMILTAEGEVDEAIPYFERGLALGDKNQTSSTVMLLYGYAQAYEKLGRYNEAIELLKQALNITVEHRCLVHRNDLMDELSVCYERLGQYEQALIWQRRLVLETDSTFVIGKERIISDLRIKYDMERQENLIQQSQLSLLRKEKQTQLLVAILVVILLVALSLWYLYRRKDKLYTSIVRQNQEALRREEHLKEVIRLLEKSPEEEPIDLIPESEKYVVSSLTDEKKHSLFQRIEALMREQTVYRDNLLTKEKVADMLGTNRTYLSQAINEQTGETFTQYINSYRINEAVRLLSDPLNETPLKAIAGEVGFNSMTTFYKLFQASVGMPPKQYREKVMELHKNG